MMDLYLITFDIAGQRQSAWRHGREDAWHLVDDIEGQSGTLVSVRNLSRAAAYQDETPDFLCATYDGPTSREIDPWLT